MIDAADIGDRHSRPVGGLGDGGGLAVRILAGPQSRLADQHLLACLVNLLCRLAGSVSAIAIDVDDDAVSAVPLPNGAAEGPTFERLRAFAHWATGGAIPVTRRLDVEDAFTISLDPDAPMDMVSLYAEGLGWIAWVGTSPPRPTGAPDDGNPIGPWFTACLAAGEVFKHARGLRKGRFARNDGYSLWCGGTGSPVDLEQGPTLVGHAVPPFYLVGAGAVGQGLLAILGVSGVQTFVVTIDDDVHDGTNLNRCFIAGTADVPRPKVDAVARYRSLTGLAGAEFAGTLSQFVVNGPLVEMPPAMREAQAEERFELIVSAVDKNTSRADVQGVRPELVVGGSTDQLTARAMTYGLRAGDPCLACYNPPEVVGVVRGKLDRRIRELTEIDGRAMLADKGLDAAAIDAVIDHVRKSPICGSAGDQALGVLATASQREFSASFVSLAGAILAFVRLLQATALADMQGSRPMMTTFAFRNLMAVHGAVPRDPECKASCHAGLVDRYTDGPVAAPYPA